jgi:hypothetical protein
MATVSKYSAFASMALEVMGSMAACRESFRRRHVAVTAHLRVERAEEQEKEKEKEKEVERVGYCIAAQRRYEHSRENPKP